MNLGMYLTRARRAWPQHEAVVCGDLRISFEELDLRVNRLASALISRGAPSGTAVATYSDNRSELIEIELAIYKAGLLRVPINARLADAEVAHTVDYAGVRFLFVDRARLDSVNKLLAHHDGVEIICLDECSSNLQYAELIAEGFDDDVYVDVEPNAPAVLHFTSGSTGKLKAATQTHENRLANLRKRAMESSGADGTSERYLTAGPITHASGMAILSLLSRGATVHVLPRWDSGEFLRLVEAEQITATFLVPAMLNMVLADERVHNVDLSSLTSLRVGGAPVSPQRLREAVALFGPIVGQGYGQGETTSGITTLSADDVARAIAEDAELLLSCGRPIFDTEIRIVGDDGTWLPDGELGEVVVRGADCVAEYWKEPELSAETFRNGWVYTGDVGYLRHDGYLFIVDRKKDMIISGGFNIYCSEVEAALYAHPGVLEACVVGVPDDAWGEAVKAVVVRRPGVDFDEAELIEHCTTFLARIKKPKSIDFVDHLPTNRNGKVDRKRVREPYWVGVGRAVN